MNRVEEKIAKLVKRRPTGGIPFDQPYELDYHCPICVYDNIIEGEFDERLEWSEFEGFIWCGACKIDIPSALCVPNLSTLENNSRQHYTKSGLHEAIDVYLAALQQDAKPRNPYLTVDAIITRSNGDQVLLIERKNEPHGWALPGGFVDYGESVEDAVVREVREETSLAIRHAAQFRTYSKPDRDPRQHNVSVVFHVANPDGEAKAADDAKNLLWANIKKPPSLVFDHAQILHDFNTRNNGLR